MPVSSHVIHIWRSTASCPHHQRPVGQRWASVCSCPCRRVFHRHRRHSHTRPLCRPCRGQPGLSWLRKDSCPGCSGGRLHRCPGCYRTGLLPGHYLHPSDEDTDVTTGQQNGLVTLWTVNSKPGRGCAVRGSCHTGHQQRPCQCLSGRCCKHTDSCHSHSGFLRGKKIRQMIRF